MIKSIKFHVHSNFFSSQVSLFYGTRCLASLDFIWGSLSSYKTQRRKLYQLRDRILRDVRILEHLGFTVSD